MPVTPTRIDSLSVMSLMERREKAKTASRFGNEATVNIFEVLAVGFQTADGLPTTQHLCVRVCVVQHAKLRGTGSVGRVPRYALMCHFRSGSLLLLSTLHSSTASCLTSCISCPVLLYSFSSFFHVLFITVF